MSSIENAQLAQLIDHTLLKPEATRADVDAAVAHGAVERVRPKMMTVTAIMAGLLPILWGGGAGADVMRRIAAPMVGGMVTSTVLTLVVIPAVYSLWKERALRRAPRRGRSGWRRCVGDH